MEYFEIKIQNILPEELEILENQLVIFDISNFQVEDPRDVAELIENKTAYQWDYIDEDVAEMANEKLATITIFLEKHDFGEMFKRLTKVFETFEQVQGTKSRLEMKVSSHDDLEWKDKWKDYAKVSKLSKTIVVKPTWLEYEKQAGEKVVEIDPGMAFGTGSHATTAMCVQLMEKYLKQADMLLDVGCGSGILSVAGAFLGSKDVLGVDIDPEAVKVSRENFALNGVSDVAKAIEGNLMDGLHVKADVVVANLMADLVVALGKSVFEHLKVDGYYISSGIIDDKVDFVKESLGKMGFEILESLNEGEWYALACKKGEEADGSKGKEEI